MNRIKLTKLSVVKSENGPIMHALKIVIMNSKDLERFTLVRFFWKN